MTKLEALKTHRLVYLATPYSKYPLGIEQAFRDAAALTGMLLVAGVKVYSPIAHTHPIALYGRLDPYNHDIWLPFDQAMMDVSTACAVARLPGWDKSIGIAHEIRYFSHAGKPVIYLDEPFISFSSNIGEVIRYDGATGALTREMLYGAADHGYA